MCSSDLQTCIKKHTQQFWETIKHDVERSQAEGLILHSRIATDTCRVDTHLHTHTGITKGGQDILSTSNCILRVNHNDDRAGSRYQTESERETERDRERRMEMSAVWFGQQHVLNHSLETGLFSLINLKKVETDSSLG